MSNATHLRGSQGYDPIGPEQTFVAALNAVGPPPAMVRREHHGANHRVQPRGITAPGRNGNAHRSLSTCQPLDRLAYFSGSRVPAEGFLREDHLAVDRDFEQTTGCLDQTDVCLWIGLLQLSRQTGSSGLVVSDHAVLNCHEHCECPAKESLNRANRSGAVTRCQGDETL
jgi:hypothetical protein